MSKGYKLSVPKKEFQRTNKCGKGLIIGNQVGTNLNNRQMRSLSVSFTFS